MCVVLSRRTMRLSSGGHSSTNPALRTHTRNNTRVIGNTPRNYMADMFITRMDQLVDSSYVQRDIYGMVWYHFI